jgi:glutathione S-transferase
VLKLVIGNKNYSSWSIRPWVLLTHFGIPFETEQIWLYQPNSNEQAKRYSGSGLVPCLIDGARRIWDSLAIVEYLAERFPDQPLWPRDFEGRAIARAVTAEMHSGFSELRRNMPMNIRNRYPRKGRTEAVDRDIARVQSLWSECRARFGGGGDYLFGSFCIADAFYAPVVFRFATYDVKLSGAAGAYAERLLATPALQRLAREAESDGHALPIYDDLYG